MMKDKILEILKNRQDDSWCIPSENYSEVADDILRLLKMQVPQTFASGEIPIDNLEKIMADATEWHDLVAMHNKIQSFEVRQLIPEFIIQIKADGETKKYWKEAQKHFNRWIAIKIQIFNNEQQRATKYGKPKFDRSTVEDGLKQYFSPKQE